MITKAERRHVTPLCCDGGGRDAIEERENHQALGLSLPFESKQSAAAVVRTRKTTPLAPLGVLVAAPPCQKLDAVGAEFSPATFAPAHEPLDIRGRRVSGGGPIQSTKDAGVEKGAPLHFGMAFLTYWDVAMLLHLPTFQDVSAQTALAGASHCRSAVGGDFPIFPLEETLQLRTQSIGQVVRTQFFKTDMRWILELFVFVDKCHKRIGATHHRQTLRNGVASTVITLRLLSYFINEAMDVLLRRLQPEQFMEALASCDNAISKFVVGFLHSFCHVDASFEIFEELTAKVLIEKCAL
jgi:hypothetical protein